MKKQKRYFFILKLFKQNCRYCLFKSNSFGLCSRCIKEFSNLLNPLYEYTNSMKIISLSRYMYDVRKEILDFKLKGRREISKYFVLSLFNYPNLISDIYKYEYITYVPMDKKKEKYFRGYNQSKIIAKDLSMFLGIPVIDLVEKVKTNKTQSSVSSTERKENVKDVYRVRKGYSFKSILIIDDIFTTGATIFEIRNKIEEKYDAIIDAFVLSKTINIKNFDNSIINIKSRYFKLKDNKKVLRKRILLERYTKNMI